MAVLAATVELPLSSLGELRSALTVKAWDHATETAIVVESFTVKNNRLYVPRSFGIGVAQHIDDETVLGKRLSRNLKTVSLYDYQEPWVDDIVDHFRKGHYDVAAKAYTGFGKTVSSLEVVRRLGRATLIIVDQEFLRDQWVDSAKKFLGVAEDKIGIVQGKVCDYLGKDIVVGMVQTLYRREWSDDFYNYFGTVLLDELHSHGAEKFSKVLSMFPARYRFGVSATPNRTDALQRLLTLNFGDVKVAVNVQHKLSQVRYIEYPGVLSWYANVSPKNGRYLSEIAADTARNYLIADVIKKLHMEGHDVLAVSDRIEQAECLALVCSYIGLPSGDIGTVAGYRTVWKYAKDPTPAGVPEGWEIGTEYTPVKLHPLRKKVPRKELNEIKNSKRVLLATYGLFSKGVDVPRLSAGIDCTPRSKAQQVHGRILRKADGKMTPVWVTIRDVSSKKAEFQFGKRLGEYEVSNVEIAEWQPTARRIRRVTFASLKQDSKGRVAYLETMKIRTGPDGNDTITM